jgi:hypothetical protein
MGTSNVRSGLCRCSVGYRATADAIPSEIRGLVERVEQLGGRALPIFERWKSELPGA